MWQEELQWWWQEERCRRHLHRQEQARQPHLARLVCLAAQVAQATRWAPSLQVPRCSRGRRARRPCLEGQGRRVFRLRLGVRWPPCRRPFRWPLAVPAALAGLGSSAAASLAAQGDREGLAVLERPEQAAAAGPSLLATLSSPATAPPWSSDACSADASWPSCAFGL